MAVADPLWGGLLGGAVKRQLGMEATRRAAQKSDLLIRVCLKMLGIFPMK